MNFKKLLLGICIVAISNNGTHAQTPKTNIQKFKDGLAIKLQKEITFKGYDFDGFSICIKVNNSGKIDTTLISISAMPDIRDKLNIAKSKFNYEHLNAEIKEKGWKGVDIIIPVLSLYELDSRGKSIIELGEYASKRLDYFSTFNIISSDDYLTNCILLNPIILVSSPPVR